MSSIKHFVNVGSIFPSVIADSSYRNPSTKYNTLSGPLDNGDYIELPTSTTGAVEYYDNTGTQVTSGSWSGGFTIGNVHANVDHWIGFMLDSSGLLYAVSRDSGTSPDTMYLSSINSAGALVNIGSGQLITDFPSTVTYGNSGVYRTADGSGNIFVRAHYGGEAEINISTGAVVSGATASNNRTGEYKTPNGNTFGICTYYAGDVSAHISSSDTSRAAVILPSAQGYSGAELFSMIPMQWDGRIVMAGLSSTHVFRGVRAIKTTDFDQMVDNLAAIMGL